MADGTTSTPTERTLLILDMLGQRGPMPLADLTTALGFSRTAVWRGLDTLRRTGWVRMRQGDQAFMLTRNRVSRLRQVTSGPAEAETVMDAFQTWKHAPNLRTQLAMVTARGQVQIVEGGQGMLPQDLRPLSDPLALCSAVKLSRDELTAHIEAALDGATLEEQRSASLGQVSKHVFEIERAGHTFDDRDLLLPLRHPGGRSMALRLSPTESAQVESVMRLLASDLSAHLSRNMATPLP